MSAARRQLAGQPVHDDATLMQRLADGDLSALGTVYDRHVEEIRRFVFRATGRADEADDVTQDVFIALAGAAKRYDGRASVRAFAIGIAAKLLLQRRRRSAVALRIFSDLRDWWIDRHDHTPEQQAAEAEELSAYRAALARLSVPKRLAVIMADVEGMSGPEIAEALDVPIGTVWTRLHHARAELRSALGGRRP